MHDAHADVANKFVGQQGVAVIHDAVQDGCKAGQTEFQTDQPPEIRAERCGARDVPDDGIDDQAGYGQQGQRR